MKKISTLAGILIIVTASIVLLGGVFAYQYFVIQNANIKNQNDSVKSQNETASWQTYTNTQYGFSIQYPNNYFESINTDPQINDYLVVGQGTALLESSQTDTGSNLSVIYFPISTQKFIQETKNAEGNVANVSMQNLTPFNLNSTQAYTFESGFTGMGTVCVDNEALIPVGSGTINIILGKCDQDLCMVKECPGGDNFNLEFSSTEKNIFSQMVSSFKLTKKLNPSSL